jgi:hypothetical protein
MHPWDRLPGEPRAAHDAFMAYAALGPARSLAQAAAARRGKGAVKKGKAPGGQFGAWSSRWRWAERAAAYDDFLSAERVRAMEDIARKQAEADAESWAKFARQIPDTIRAHWQSIVTRQNELRQREGTARPPSRKAVAEVQALIRGGVPLARESLAFVAPYLLPGHQTAEKAEPVPGDISDQEAAIYNRAMAEARARGEIE